jgi:hypothetical protein
VRSQSRWRSTALWLATAAALLILAFSGPAGARTALALLGLCAVLAAIRVGGRAAGVDTTVASSLIVAAVPGLCALVFVGAAIRGLRVPQGSPGLVLALLLGAASSGAVTAILFRLIWQGSRHHEEAGQ